MKKIIITGGSRGLGQSLIEYFTKDNSAEIFVLQRNLPIQNTHASNELKIYPFYLNEMDKILASHHFEAIIHCAAQYDTKAINDGEPYSTNLVFSEIILEFILPYTEIVDNKIIYLVFFLQNPKIFFNP